MLVTERAHLDRGERRTKKLKVSWSPLTLRGYYWIGLFKKKAEKRRREKQ